MAFTRSFLKYIGLNEEQISAAIEAHTEITDALKKERDEWKGKAEMVETLTRERDEAVEKLSKAGDVNAVRKEFDDYKAGIEKEKLNAKKSAALAAAFEQAGVKRDAFRQKMLKAWDMDKVELGEDGKIKDMDGLTAAVKADYADFIATEQDNGVPPTNPPAGGGQHYTAADIEKMSYDEINKLWESGKGFPNIKK